MMVCACLVLGGLLSVLLVLLVVYVTRKQRHWQNRGIFTAPFTFMVGNLGPIVRQKKAFAHVVKDVYLSIKEKDQKYGGMYQFTKPLLLVTDPDLIRDVAVKHFGSFSSRGLVTESAASDFLFSRSVLNLKGDEWRDMRHHLSPAFTGSKMRNMVELMSNTGYQITKFLLNRSDYEEPVDIREAFRRYATDIISTTAFGTVSDSINNPESEFYRYGLKLMEPGGLRGLVVLGFFFSPKLMQLLNIPFTPASMSRLFTNIIEENINYRERENKSRPDMIQQLLETRKSKEDFEPTEKQTETIDSKGISNLDIAAQAFTFFLGGFETVSTTLSFCALELAINPEIQDRLRAEVDAAISRNNDMLTYDAIQDLKYMDMVLSEVLRKYPPTPFADRVCNEAINLHEYNLKLKEGDTIGFPIYALQHDPEFFPDPDRFDPERFNEANKQKIKPFTYLPFGAGPRNCIGMRFALLEMKLCMAHILATTELHVCERTQLPITLSKTSPQMMIEGGFWFTVRPRDFPSLINPEATSNPVDVK